MGKGKKTTQHKTKQSIKKERKRLSGSCNHGDTVRTAAGTEDQTGRQTGQLQAGRSAFRQEHNRQVMRGPDLHPKPSLQTSAQTYVSRKSETRMTASVLKQYPDTLKGSK